MRKIDIDAIRSQLALLGHADKPVQWQVFHDAGGNPEDFPPRGWHATFEESRDRLYRYNADGYGIYMAVNATDGHGRRLHNITAATHIFLDLDGTPLPDDGFPITPTLVNQTSKRGDLHKYQCWWPITPTQDLDLWRAIQKLLAERYGGDVNCALPTQVGRVAGFWHQKDPNNPWLVRAAEGQGGGDALWGEEGPLLSFALAFGFDQDDIEAHIRREREAREARMQRRVVEPPPWGFDHDVDVQRARGFLRDPDNWTETKDGQAVKVYKEANRLLDWGISPDLAAELLEEYCPVRDKRWPEDFFRAKVEHALKYRQTTLGLGSFLASFGDQWASDEPEPEMDEIAGEDDPADDDVVRHVAPRMIHLVGKMREEDIPVTPWLVDGLLLKGQATGVGGPGGVGKSAWLLSVAVACSLGLSSTAGFWPGTVERKKCRVLVLSGEDDVMEIERRVAAVCHSIGVDRADLAPNLLVYKSSDIALVARLGGSHGATERTPLWSTLRRVIRKWNIDLVTFDPFIQAASGLSESDNNDMQALSRAVIEAVEGTECAALILDHTRKGAGGGADAFRGGSAKVNAFRQTFLMRSMTDGDVKELKLSKSIDPSAFVGISSPKANYVRRMQERWYEHKVFDLANGEARSALVARHSLTDMLAVDVAAFEEWEHAQWLLDRVAEGRDDGEPWNAARKAAKALRLDAYVQEALDMPLDEVWAMLDAAAEGGYLVQVEKKDSSHKMRTHWQVGERALGDPEPVTG